jgi:hypothetical protein
VAVHENVGTMAVEAIQEYLAASEKCLEFRKSDGGCLGYPATLLLFCVVNALGTYLVGDEVVIEGRKQKITSGEPFRVLNHPCFGLSFREREIKKLEHAYRNKLAHAAIIDFGTSLIGEDGQEPFVFDEEVGIRVPAFYGLVARAWCRFDKERIQEWAARFSQ